MDLKKLIVSSATACALLLSCSVVSKAAQPDDVNLGEVVVQATKSETKLKDVPATVYIVTGKDIKQTSDTRNLGDILWEVPGIFGEDKRHTDSNVISFRGVTLHDWVTYGILVLVDGIPLNDADGRVDFEGINLDNVKRIEVIKGPVSALYGPNGTVGVINIVTKNPPKKLTGKAYASYGSYKTWKLYTEGGKSFKNVGVWLSAMRYGSQGYRPRNSYFEDKLSGKVTGDLGDAGHITSDLYYGHVSRETPGPLNEEEFENQERIATRESSSSEMDLYRLGVAYRKAWDASSIHLSAYFHRRKRDSQWTTGITNDHINTFGSEARFIQKYTLFNLQDAFTVGASLMTEGGVSKYWMRNRDGSKGTQTRDGYSRQTNYGVYAQNVLALARPLKVTLGVRYDRVHFKYDDRIKSNGDDSGTRTMDAWSPKVGITYEAFKGQTFYINIGKGFVPPTLYRLFSGRYANKDLKPQYLTDYEIGVRGNIATKLHYEMAVYYMKFKDQIQYDPVTERYENIGNTKHKGFEVSLKYRFLKHFILRGNYSFNISRFDNDPVYGNNFVKKAPKHMMGLGVTYINRGLTLSMWMRKVWKYYMDNENTKYYGGYTLLNAKVSYHWHRVFASLYVNNLLDNNYATWATRYTRRGRTTDYYFPGWPLNVMFTLGMKF